MEENIEIKYVASFYNRNAAEFGRTRRKPWPVVDAFIKKNASSSALILDNGCGNGRSMTCSMVGVDISLGLLQQACAKNPHGLVHGNSLKLPFIDGCFDLVLSVAVIHHFCTEKRRIAAVREIARVMARGGRVLVCVWSDCIIEKKKVFQSRELVCSGDVFISWGGCRDNRRYYHLFHAQELADLVSMSGLVIMESGQDGENFYVIAEKRSAVSCATTI
eukprot:jgi/Antlo1/864/1975